MSDHTIVTPVVPVVPGVAAPVAQPAVAADPAAFRRILERLEQLAHAAPATEVKDAESLATAMQKAEDGFTSAMDLRRQLEAAFRERTR